MFPNLNTPPHPKTNFSATSRPELKEWLTFETHFEKYWVSLGGVSSLIQVGGGGDGNPDTVWAGGDAGQ